MDRVIFHCDCNGFYASVEEIRNPALKEAPMAVSWSRSSRRGVILAKNELAKKYGVQTAEPVGRALQKCPGLVLTKARHDVYREYSRTINRIYESYTDQVERFGIDESYLDVTGSLHLFGGDPVALAHTIRERVHREVGLTISVGVSFNKSFAKIGSDYKKPNAVTHISRENFREIVWPLPASALLYVGKVTGQAMGELHIHTIGDLATADRALLARRFGKMGEQLARNACGEDDSPVAMAAETGETQSVGNGSTFYHNLTSREEVRTVIAALSDTVGSRLRRSGLKCMTAQVTIKDADFKVITRQKGVDPPTWLAKDLAEACMELMDNSWPEGKPVRMLTVTASKLLPAEMAGEQQSLFDAGGERRQKRENLEKTIDSIRGKFGGGSLSLASTVRHGNRGEEEGEL